jgi:hypothetical protein
MSMKTTSRRPVGENRPLTNEDLVRLCLPRDYWDVRHDQIKPAGSVHFQAITKYITRLHEMVENGWGLILYGPNDTGKSALAALVLKEARRWGYYGMFARAEALRVAGLRDTMFDESMSLVDRARFVTVLVIDDLGKEHRSSSGHAERFIEDLVRERVSEKLVTIMTTNIDPRPKKMSENKGAKTVHPLADIYSQSFAHVVKSRFHPVPVKGYNYREEQAQELADALGSDA